MKKPLRTLILFSFFLITFYSCDKTDCPAHGSTAATLNDYTGLDGCSWVITLEDGQVLEPANLDEYPVQLQENKKIWIEYHELPDLASICMRSSSSRALSIGFAMSFPFKPSQADGPCVLYIH